MTAQAESARTTRRAVLRGAGAAAALVSAAAFPAVAAAPDAELVAIGERQQALFAESSRLNDAIEEIEDALRALPVPPALRKRKGDEYVGVGGGSCLTILEHDVEQVGLRLADGDLLVRHRPRAEEIVAAWAAQEKVEAAAAKRLGLPAVKARSEQVDAELDALFRRMVELRAATPAGLRVKARCLSWWLGGNPEDPFDFDIDWSDIAARSLARDLLALEA